MESAEEDVLNFSGDTEALFFRVMDRMQLVSLELQSSDWPFNSYYRARFHDYEEHNPVCCLPLDQMLLRVKLRLLRKSVSWVYTTLKDCREREYLDPFVLALLEWRTLQRAYAALGRVFENRPIGYLPEAELYRTADALYRFPSPTHVWRLAQSGDLYKFAADAVISGDIAMLKVALKDFWTRYMNRMNPNYLGSNRATEDCKEFARRVLHILDMDHYKRTLFVVIALFATMSGHLFQHIVQGMRVYYQAVEIPIVSVEEVSSFLDFVLPFIAPVAEVTNHGLRSDFVALFPESNGPSTPRMLKHLCRCVIREELQGRDDMYEILQSLPVPGTLREYLLLSPSELGL